MPLDMTYSSALVTLASSFLTRLSLILELSVVTERQSVGATPASG